MHNELVVEKINLIFNLYFQYNLFLDDMVYAFELEYYMPKFAEVIHNISHMMPDIADDIQEFAKKRGIKLKRKDLFSTEEVSSEKKWIETALAYAKQIEGLYFEAISLCAEEGEFALEDTLREKLKGIQTDITHQFKVFAEGYDNLEQEGLAPLWNSEYLSYMTLYN